jgi:sulfotransferase
MATEENKQDSVLSTSSSNSPEGTTRRYHFISGLPRSGSTLLSALLRQNPRFHAEMSSPVGGLFGSLLTDMSAKNEGVMFIDDEQRKRILRGLFDNFYADHHAEVVFDTNRLWCTKLPALKSLFPEARIIACVRNVSWIVDSIERLVRKNAFQPSSIFGYQSGGTVYTRANGVAGSDGLVGFGFDALKEAVFGEDAPDRLCLVRYESLTANPKAAMKEIYSFLGEPAFEHDFDNIEYDDRGFDAKAGTPGLHTVQKRIHTNQRKTILPPDLFKRFENDAFWQNKDQLPKGVRLI